MELSIPHPYQRIVRRRFPDLSSRDVRAFEGNDHYVFEVDDELAFRFPKVPREIDPKRSRFVQRFADLSPLPVPQIEIHRDGHTGLEYEIVTYLPGVPLYPSVAQEFTDEELATVADELGRFLGALHSFPVEEAGALGIDELDPSEFWAYMEQNERAYPRFKRLVFPHVSTAEREWVEALFTDYIALVRANPFPTTMTHSDMWVFHIIVDPEAHTLTGVIDYGLRIADPARDFKPFEHYGSDFVDAVYRSYSPPIDDQFDQRRLFYTGHDEVFELARQIERGNEEQIAQHRRSLSAYISSHALS